MEQPKVETNILKKKTSLPSTPSHLSYVEEQSYGVVEVGVGASCVDPEVPQNWKQSRAGQQDAGHQEDVPQDWRIGKTDSMREEFD